MKKLIASTPDYNSMLDFLRNKFYYNQNISLVFNSDNSYYIFNGSVLLDGIIVKANKNRFRLERK